MPGPLSSYARSMVAIGLWFASLSLVGDVFVWSQCVSGIGRFNSMVGINKI